MHRPISARISISLFALLVTMVFVACGETTESSNAAQVSNPVIASFVATPATIGSGDSSVLSWSVSGATSVSLDQGIGDVLGNSITVTPTTTTTYILTAANNAGSATKTAVVTVGTKGAYFGQPLPGETPVLFAPAIVTSLSAFADGPAFSPDGTQCFMGVGDATYSSGKLYYSTSVNDVWTPFVEAPFVSDFTFSHEPVFSADGSTLTFTGSKSSGTTDLLTANYTGQQWGTLVALPAPINSDAHEWRGSYVQDGTFYFGSERANPGINQVYKAYWDSDQNLVVELMGPPISVNSYEGDPCVAPDGHFLIFYSGRNGTDTDLYVSFSDGNGGWGTPILLGPDFNTSNDEYGAHLTSDGQYLFFTRHTSQGNGIYWVATSAIEKLKP